MPVKNTLKKYVPGGIYHVYSRGVDKRSIFMCEEDAMFFLLLLRSLTTTEKTWVDLDLKRKNYAGKVDVLAFCLMKNHFHILIKQGEPMVIAEFMQSLITSFVMHINNKYKRTGRLFESVYKARLITNEHDLKNISKYIHLNPADGSGVEKILCYPFSSIRCYIGVEKDSFDFINTKTILELFNFSKARYKNFLNSN